MGAYSGSPMNASAGSVAVAFAEATVVVKAAVAVIVPKLGFVGAAAGVLIVAVSGAALPHIVGTVNVIS